MKTLNSLLLVLGLFYPLTPVSAQVPFPPTAMSSVQSPDAAAQALGAPRPEFSTHVLLDTPEISLSGEVVMSVRSEIPGTSQIFLFRQFPRAPQITPVRPAASGLASATPSVRAKPGTSATPNAPAPTPTVFLAAVQLKPGEAPTLKTRVLVDRNERFTTLVFAQGRWFFTSRELKLAKPLTAAATP